MLIDKSTSDRFWALADIKGEDDCWNWLGAKSKTGNTVTGHWAPPRESELSPTASRAAYQMTYGAIAKEARVKHICKSSICVNPKHLTAKQPIERFWEKVDSETPGQGIGDCWFWKGSLTTAGYGQFRIDPKKGHQSASRIAYVLTYGEIPRNAFVCHRCDLRNCCQPKHLFVGSQSDNLSDMVMKRRGPSGEKNHESKLSESDVAQIKKLLNDGVAQHVIGKRFNVTQACISRIKTGKGWRHLDKKAFKARTLSKLQEEGIVNLLAQGVSQKEIAEKFSISQAKVSKVKTANKLLLQKLTSNV